MSIRHYWCDDDVARAAAILSEFPAERFAEGIAAVGAAVGLAVSAQSLDSIFRRKGLATPRSFCRGAGTKGPPSPTSLSVATPAPGAAVPRPMAGVRALPTMVALPGAGSFASGRDVDGPPTERSLRPEAIADTEPDRPPPPRKPLKSGVFDAAGRRAPQATGKISLDEEAAAVVDAARRAKRGEARSLTELCDELDLSPRRLREALERAREAGAPVHVVHDHVAFALRDPDEGTMRVVDAAAAPSPVVGERYTVGAFSDLHLGSKYCMRAQLRDFVDYLYDERGVRTIVCSGDVLDGTYKHGKFEVTHVGLEAQTDDLYETLPHRPGLHYYAIDGNHDDTMSDDVGVVAGHYVEMSFRERGREDWHFLGRRSAFLRVGGIVINLWHPKGSIGYSTDYKLLKKIESYSPGAKPNVLITGHWHRYCVCESRGVVGIACPTFQAGGSAFGNSLVGNPALGGLALSWQLTAEGTMRRFESERVSYFEREQLRDLDGLTRAPRHVVAGRAV